VANVPVKELIRTIYNYDVSTPVREHLQEEWNLAYVHATNFSRAMQA